RVDQETSLTTSPIKNCISRRFSHPARGEIPEEKGFKFRSGLCRCPVLVYRCTVPNLAKKPCSSNLWPRYTGKQQQSSFLSCPSIDSAQSFAMGNRFLDRLFPEARSDHSSCILHSGNRTDSGRLQSGGRDPDCIITVYVWIAIHNEECD